MKKITITIIALWIGLFVGVSINGADAHDPAACPPVVPCECPEPVPCLLVGMADDDDSAEELLMFDIGPPLVEKTDEVKKALDAIKDYERQRKMR